MNETTEARRSTATYSCGCEDVKTFCGTEACRRKRAAEAVPVRTVRLSDLTPLFREAIRASEEAGGVFRAEDIRPSPETLAMWDKTPTPAAMLDEVIDRVNLARGGTEALIRALAPTSGSGYAHMNVCEASGLLERASRLLHAARLETEAVQRGDAWERSR